jgi:hypothetical protein
VDSWVFATELYAGKRVEEVSGTWDTTQKMWAWSPSGGEEYVPLDEAASSSRRSVIRRAVLFLGVAACVGVVALKPQSGRAGQMLTTTILGAGSKTHASPRALSIKSKRRDETYPMLASKLLDAYKIELLAEPHVEMHLELDGCSDDADACAGVTWSATPVEQDIMGTVDFDDSVTGPSVFMTFTGVSLRCRCVCTSLMPYH